MIQLSGISLSFGSREIFKSLNWSIKEGKRIGLFGPNGVGKTTLLNMIAGKFTPDEGKMSIPSSHVIGYLPQEAQEEASDRTVLSEALTAFKDIMALELEEEALTKELGASEEQTSPEYKKILLKLDTVHEELRSRDSHTVRYQTEKMLTGLGFEPGELDKPLDTFSGGWRMRVALAKLLLQKPNVLLLDEPTNHLDIESIDWLESYLERLEGSVVLVSHDRYFLDRMVNTIAELEGGQITEFTGNYSTYLTQKSSRLEIQKSAYENQQRKIKDTERFIERFRYKNTKAKQVQSRIKMLEKLQRIPEPAAEGAPIHIKFPEPERSGKVVLELSEFSKAYPGGNGKENEVFSAAGPLSISRGDKIALIGKNGAGKSTLSRILVGEEPFAGDRKEGHNVELTFFAQHQAQTLDPTNTIIEELESESRGRSETEIRSLLGAFLFSGEDVYKKVGVLSGGEKSRVALAKTLLYPKNFMILDEPTNHLDIQSRNVLVDALRHYGGTFVIVSHDRHFLDRVANKVWYAEDKKIVTYPGTYSEFHYHQNLRESGGGSSASFRLDTSFQAHSSDGKTPGVKKRDDAKKRNRLYRELKERGLEGMENWRELTHAQLRDALAELEDRIHSAEDNRDQVEKYLAAPESFKDKERSEEAAHDYSKLNDQLKKLYVTWDSVTSHLDSLSGD
jgi:ATP-binding cassette, subfamily F, member 3